MVGHGAVVERTRTPSSGFLGEEVFVDGGESGKTHKQVYENAAVTCSE